MNTTVANILKAYIAPMAFADRLAGVVRVAQFVDEGKKKFSVPVACDVSESDCLSGKYNDLCPNDSKKSVIYFEDTGGVQQIGRKANNMQFRAQLRLVGWLNLHKLGTEDCNISSAVVSQIMAAMPIQPINTSIFIRFKVTAMNEAPKSAAIFSRYSYEEPVVQYLLYPFDYFAIDFTVEFEVNRECVDDFIAGNVIDCPTETGTGEPPAPSLTFCERVDECLEIPEANGNYVLKILNGVKSWIAATGGGVWGSITGTLSAQADLQAALDAKATVVALNSEASTRAAADTAVANAAATDATTKANAAETNAKAYADTLVVGLIDDRGNYDASVNTFPASGGSGTAGAILKGDLWTVSVAGTLGGNAVTAGDLVRALADTPGQTASNWAVTENNIGYVAENQSNKATTMTGNESSNTVYLSAKAVYDWAVATFQAALTAANFGSFINGLTAKATPVDADMVPLMDSADSNNVKKLSWANIKATLKTYFDTLYQPTATYLQILHQNYTRSSVTGTTAETLMASYMIPAGTFSAGHSCDILTRTKATGIYTLKLRIHTANSLAGNIIISAAQSSAPAYIGTARHLMIHSATDTGTTTSAFGTDQANAASASDTTYNIDWTVDQYVIVSVQPAASGTVAHFCGLRVCKA